jgi:hypothetical protein
MSLIRLYYKIEIYNLKNNIEKFFITIILMRFLKKKIAKANDVRIEAIKAAHKLQKSASSDHTSSSPISSQSSPNSNKKRTRVQGYFFTSEASRATKNIVKNYGKAICKFIASPLATPYLDAFLETENVSFRGFISFVNNSKTNIDGLYNFRSVILIDEKDDQETAAYKRIFTELSEVFIKYFSVNWIFHSKVFHKEAHLKFRFKMLRRIRNPELFTYLKNSKDASKRRAIRR